MPSPQSASLPIPLSTLPRTQWLPALATLFIFSILSIYCGFCSEGFVAGDACTHYLSARYAWSHPQNFVDVWNRPLVTALYAIPAILGGRPAVRIVCMLVAVGCGLVSCHIARGQGVKSSVLALIFTLGQPLLFLHSFGEMTELPFALVLGSAFLAFQKNRLLLATLLISWTPLARPEGFGMVAIAIIALLIARKWRYLIVLPGPIVIWNVAGWLLSGRIGPWWKWLESSWPYAGESLYGRGYLLTFVALLPAVVSPMVLPAMLVGIWRSITCILPKTLSESALPGSLSPIRGEEGWDKGPNIKQRGVERISKSRPSLQFDLAHCGQPSPPHIGEREQEDTPVATVPTPEHSPFAGALASQQRFLMHAQRCQVITVALPLFVLCVHSVLFWLGKMASFGEARYLLVVAPFWGVLSARGWEWTFDRLQWRHPCRWAAAAVLIPPILANAVHPVVPIHFSQDWQVARQWVAWYQANPLHITHPKVMASHPAVDYFLDINPYLPGKVRTWDKPTLLARPTDTVLIWDPIFGERNASGQFTLRLDEIRQAGWLEIPLPPLPKIDGQEQWHLFVVSNDSENAKHRVEISPQMDSDSHR